MKCTTISYTIFQIDEIADQLAQLAKEYKILAFQGSLGAGKTTMVKALLKKLGVTEVITSPTYTYVNQYRVGERVYNHFDLYRLDSPGEFLEFGFDEYLQDPEAVCLIEWPGVIEELLDDSVATISIEHGDDNRLMKICIPE